MRDIKTLLTRAKTLLSIFKEKLSKRTPKNTESAVSATADRRKKAIKIVIIIVVVLVIGSFVFGKNVPIKKAGKAEPSAIQIDDHSESTEHQWAVEAEQSVGQNAKAIAALSKQLHVMEGSDQSKAKEIAALKTRLLKAEAEEKQAEASYNALKASPNLNGASDNKHGKKRGATAGHSTPNSAPNFNPAGVGIAGAQRFGPVYQSVASVGMTSVHFADPGAHNKTKPRELVKNSEAGYLPMSQFQAYTMYSFDAHTSQGAMEGTDSLVPVVMRIKSNAITANGKRYSLKGCLLLGQAYGDLNDMRAQVRVTTLECLNTTGRYYVSGAAKGIVVDGDGSVGLRGVYKSYQGARLKMAFLSSALAGMGNAFGASQGTTFTSPATGSAPIIAASGSEVLRQGLGGGLSGGANMLAKFYVDQLKMLSPVIHVSGGRLITVNLTQGVILKWQDRKDEYIPAESPSSILVDKNGKVVTGDGISANTTSTVVRSQTSHANQSAANTLVQSAPQEKNIAKSVSAPTLPNVPSANAKTIEAIYQKQRQSSNAQNAADIYSRYSKAQQDSHFPTLNNMQVNH